MDKRTITRGGILVSVVLIAILLLVGFCGRQGGKDPSAAALVPKDAAFVLVLDIPQMVGKVNFEIIKRSQNFQASLADIAVDNPVFGEIMRNPTEAGIDYYKPALVAYRKNPEKPEEDFTAILLPLAKSSAFEKIINKSTLEEKRSNKGFKSVHLDALSTVGWNNNVAILGAADVVLDLDANLDLFFNNSPSNSVMTIPSFQETMEQNGDFLFWVSTSGIVTDAQALSAYGLRDLPLDIIRDNYILGDLNFGKGEITGLAKFRFKREVESRVENFFAPTFDTDFTPFIKDKNRQGTFFASLNLSGIYNYSISDQKTKDGLEGFLQQYGINLKELFKVFGGDLMITSYREEGEEESSVVFGTKIFRPDLLQNYLDVLADKEYIMPVSEGLYATQVRQSSTDTLANANQDQLSFHLIQKEDKLFFTDGQEIIQAIINGGYSRMARIGEDLSANMTDDYLRGYVNFANMANQGGGTEDLESLKLVFNKEALEFEVSLKDKSAYALEKILSRGFE